MRTTSAPVMVIFFENGILNLITARFKVPLQQIRGTLSTAFWKILYNFLFYEHGSTCALNLSSRLSVNVTETRIDEGAWKKIVTQNAPLYLTNLVFKFNAVLVGFFFFFFLIMSAAIYLFSLWLTFDISLVLKFIWCLYAFYKE